MEYKKEGERREGRKIWERERDEDEMKESVKEGKG